jgi:hypothetical protein
VLQKNKIKDQTCNFAFIILWTYSCFSLSSYIFIIITILNRKEIIFKYTFIQGVGSPLQGRARVFKRGGGVWSGLSCWGRFVRFRDGVEDLRGGWFRDCVQRKVGDGLYTFLWTDSWLEGSPLCEVPALIRFSGE